jgi:hypothetical protein
MSFLNSDLFQKLFGRDTSNNPHEKDHEFDYDAPVFEIVNGSNKQFKTYHYLCKKHKSCNTVSIYEKDKKTLTPLTLITKQDFGDVDPNDADPNLTPANHKDLWKIGRENINKNQSE